MKARTTVIMLVGLFAVAIACGHAQQSFESTTDSQSSPLQEKQEGKVVVPSQHSSVVVMMSEHGLEILSPGADAQLGEGQKLLTEPVESETRVVSDIYDKKPFGGIRLIGWFF